MRGVSKIPFPYISEFDRGLPKEEQSTFWIIQQTVMNSIDSLARYSKGVATNKVTGADDVDTIKWVGADKESFMEYVHHVDNFFFDGESESVDIKAENIELKEKLFYQLPPTVLKELKDKSNEPRITLTDKKKSK